MINLAKIIDFSVSKLNRYKSFILILNLANHSVLNNCGDVISQRIESLSMTFTVDGKQR